jgi:hypothetical protein
LAARANVAPWRYSIRHLLWMANDRASACWDHTAHLSAVITNCHRNRKKRPIPFRAEEFHPDHLGKIRRRSGTPYTSDVLRREAAAYRARQGLRDSDKEKR